MTSKAIGYAATSPKDDLAPYLFERRDPRPDDVVIEILQYRFVIDMASRRA